MTAPYNVYLVSFNATDVSLPVFENFLRQDPAILGFWNYIPLVYLVKSNLPVSDLAARVRTHMAGRHCLVAEINPGHVDGWLPKAAWDWFRSAPDKRMAIGILGQSPPPPMGGVFGLGSIPQKPSRLHDIFAPYDPTRK